MKIHFSLITLLALAAGTANATPLDRTKVGGEAKWLLHIDLDQGKKTKTGAYLLDQFLVRKGAKAREDLRREIGFDLDWSKVRGITAYGSTFGKQDKNGLLVIESSLPLEKGFEAAVERKHPSFRVEKLGEGQDAVYRINEAAYTALAKGGMLLVSRSKVMLEYGREVILGRRPNLSADDPFKNYPETQPGFFLLALAEGFAEKAPLPAKAAVLKEAKGGRILFGEEGEQARLRVDLRARSADTAKSILQVAQGLVGLAALQAENNADLKPLVQGANVSANDNFVTLAVGVPANELVDRIKEREAKK
jgi:hypothetical protein